MTQIKHDCSHIFDQFEYQDIRTADPPDRKGIYVIRVVKRGLDVEEIISEIEELLARIDWVLVGKKARNRLDRLRNIGECPYIYIGSAGPRSQSKHTLKGRYRDFSSRHTAMYPIWALLHFGWELEYGWMVVEESGKLEKEFKSRYREIHNGSLPALVVR